MRFAANRALCVDGLRSDPLLVEQSGIFRSIYALSFSVKSVALFGIDCARKVQSHKRRNHRRSTGFAGDNSPNRPEY